MQHVHASARQRGSADQRVDRCLDPSIPRKGPSSIVQAAPSLPHARPSPTRPDHKAPGHAIRARRASTKRGKCETPIRSPDGTPGPMTSDPHAPTKAQITGPARPHRHPRQRRRFPLLQAGAPSIIRRSSRHSDAQSILKMRPKYNMPLLHFSPDPLTLACMKGVGRRGSVNK